MDLRELKGLEMAARMPLQWKDGAGLVPSQSGSGKYKGVLQPNGQTCACEDFPVQHQTCKHRHAARFTVKEVPADKAYVRHENLQLVDGLGGTALVPFQVNSVAGEVGSVWERMFHYDPYRREEFLKHYHQRRNAASTLSMVQAKFREHVRSKPPVAMTNEVLCKLLCHNIGVVIMWQCDRGIEAVCWAEEPKDGPDAGLILRIPRGD